MSDIHGGNIFKFAHEQRIEPYEVIDFSANINPLGLIRRDLMRYIIDCGILIIIRMPQMMMY